MSKNCLIKQPAGIGDIFFLQKVAKKYINDGYNVYWPVINEYLFLKDYIKVDKLNFVSESEDFPMKSIYPSELKSPHIVDENNIFLPIKNFDQNYPSESVMYSKYKVLGLDYSDWKDFFQFERNLEKEESLLKVLGLEGKKFNLVNRLFGSPPNMKKCIHMGDYPDSFEMTLVEGYNLFDWIGVFLSADHIYTVETSIMYLITKLSLKNVTVFSKFDKPTYFHVSDLFDKDLNYIL